MAHRRIAIALAISLLLHLALVASPGWLLPGAETVKSVPIQAVLRPPPKLAAAPAPETTPPTPPRPATPIKPRPKSRPKPELPRAEIPSAVPAVPAEQASAEAPADEVSETGPPSDLAAGDSGPAPSQADEPGATVSTPPPAPADIFPYHGRVVFEAARGAGGFVVGTAETVWLTQDGRYQFRLYLQTSGLVALLKRITLTYASDGRITGNGFMPQTYRMDQDGQLKESATFDWEHRRLAIVSNKGHGSFDLMEASQDFISAIFQLAIFPPAESPSDVWVASGRYYTNRYFEVLGTEELTTRLGPLRTLRVRLGREGDEQLDLWYAIDLRHMPVRIRWTQKDGGINDFVAVYIEYDTGKDRIRLAPPPRMPAPAG